MPKMKTTISSSLLLWVMILPVIVSQAFAITQEEAEAAAVMVKKTKLPRWFSPMIAPLTYLTIEVR